MITFLISLASFLLISISTHRLGRVFQKIHLPFITGVLVVGMLSGPFVLNLIKAEHIPMLNIFNHLSLSFIALAAGAELYLNEFRSEIKKILINCAWQLSLSFIISIGLLLLLGEYIPFVEGQPIVVKFSVVMLMSAIFIARSPSSAIALINELRAKGPFSRTILGVTILTDVLVIILFAICMAFANAFAYSESIDGNFVIHILIELVISVVIGYILSKCLEWMLSLHMQFRIKNLVIVAVSFLFYYVAHDSKDFSEELFGFQLTLEPLLICIIGGFGVVNYTKYRYEFLSLINKNDTYIYVFFFTLTGASMALDKLSEVGLVVVLLVLVRLGSFFISNFVAGLSIGQSLSLNSTSWMAYITQAGVGLGLAKVVEQEFTDWGSSFATAVIGSIIINQLIGPPLFKWVIQLAGESHVKAKSAEYDGHKDVFIFGYENLTRALTKQLFNNDWHVKIIVLRSDDQKTMYGSLEQMKKTYSSSDVEVEIVDRIDLGSLQQIQTQKADAILTLLSDEVNYEICSLIYEHFGTQLMITRLQERTYFDKFHSLGVRIVDPATAMVSLFDQFIRSPIAASLIMGMEEGQDTMDVVVRNKNLYGLYLREIRLPKDVIVLSVKRKGQFIISHGFTRLRRRDILTIVGSKEELKKIQFRFEEA